MIFYRLIHIKLDLTTIPTIVSYIYYPRDILMVNILICWAYFFIYTEKIIQLNLFITYIKEIELPVYAKSVSLISYP
mgnify:FL=1|jgi:hypothetical protein